MRHAGRMNTQVLLTVRMTTVEIFASKYTGNLHSNEILFSVLYDRWLLCFWYNYYQNFHVSTAICHMCIWTSIIICGLRRIEIVVTASTI